MERSSLWSLRNKLLQQIAPMAPAELALGASETDIYLRLFSMTQNSAQDSRNPKYHSGIGVALGVVIGATLGAAFDHVGLGVALGTTFGAALGIAVHRERKSNQTPDPDASDGH